MNEFILDSLTHDKNKAEYRYTVSGDWEKVFGNVRSLCIEYSCDISKVPESILVLPLLANILPVSWIYDASISIPACDKAFYESIKDFKNGYMGMYPSIDFKGSINIGNVEENHPGNNGGALSFFSGGVDAFNTLISHAAEHPTLVTIWGADIKTSDEKGWSNVFSHLKDTAREFEADYVVVKSEFRNMLVEHFLTEAISQSGDNWWHGFQHGIGIISHAAPIAYAMKKGNVYIASSFSMIDKEKVTCASDPSIDNYVRFGDTKIIHDGYEYNRQMKVNNIVKYTIANNKTITLRVCWESAGGSNCCNCEKCFRTIMAIIAEKQDPRKFGFCYTEKQFNDLAFRMRYERHPAFGELRYQPIVNRLKENLRKEDLPKAVQWIYDYDFSRIRNTPFWYRCLRYIKRYIKDKT